MIYSCPKCHNPNLDWDSICLTKTCNHYIKIDETIALQITTGQASFLQNWISEQL